MFRLGLVLSIYKCSMLQCNREKNKHNSVDITEYYGQILQSVTDPLKV